MMKLNTIIISVLAVLISILLIEVKATCINGAIKTTTTTINNCPNLKDTLIDYKNNITITTVGYKFSLTTLNTDIFVGDSMYGTITKYNLNGVSNKQISNINCYSISPSNENLYVSNSKSVVVYDSDLNQLPQTKSGFSDVWTLFYDKATQKLHVADSATKKVTILNDNLDELDSFYWTQSGTVVAITVYNGVVYLAGQNIGGILIYQNKGFVENFSVCGGSDVQGLHFDSCNKYIFVTCQTEQKIELYKINGISLTYVAAKQLTLYPKGISVDSMGRIIFTHSGGPTNGFTILG